MGIKESTLGVVLLVIAGAAPGTTIRVDLPAQKVWCISGDLVLKEGAAPTEGSDFLAAQMKSLRDEASKKGLVSIGLPFVRDPEVQAPGQAEPPAAAGQGEQLEQRVELTVCSAVAEDAPQPEPPIRAETEPAYSGAAMLCDGDPDPCMNAVENEMGGAPWNLPAEQVAAAVHRACPALGRDQTPENLIASLTSTKGIILAGIEAAPIADDAVSVVAVLVAARERPEAKK